MNYNTELIETFFTHFSSGNAIDALNCLNEDVQWQAMGLSGGLPMSGVMDKKAIGDLIEKVIDITESGLNLKATGWTVENNRLAVEAQGIATLKNGKKYHNFYHFLIEIKNNKIQHIKEYMDTYQVYNTFMQ